MPHPRAATPRAPGRTGRAWRPVLALGILTALVGVVLTAFPVVAAFAVNLVVGVTLVVAGAERLVDSRRGPERVVGIVLGLVGVALGLAALLFPRVTLLVLVALTGWSLLVAGVGGIAGGIALRGGRAGVWMLATGVLDLAVGVLALSWPRATILVISLLFGVRTLLAGLADVAYALAARRAEAEAEAGAPPARR